MNIIDMTYLVSVLIMSVVVLGIHKQIMIVVDKQIEKQCSSLNVTSGVRTFVQTFTVLATVLTPVLNTYFIVKIIFSMLKLMFKK